MIKRVLTVLPFLVPLVGCGVEPGEDFEQVDTTATEASDVEIGTTQQAVVSPVTGNKQVVVALYEADTSLPLNHGRNPEWWRSRVFGDASTLRNVASYIQANAKGRFSMIPATSSVSPNPPQNAVRLLTDTQWRGNEVVLDFPSIPAGASRTLSVTLNGTQVNDAILLRPRQADIERGLGITAFVSLSPNVASVTIRNTTSAAIDPTPRRYGAYSTALDQRAGITRAMYISTDPERWTKIERRRMVQMLVESGFDFRPFDRNSDNVIGTDELTILGFSTREDGGGLVRDPVGGCVPVGNGKSWCGPIPVPGFRSSLMNIAHELSHVITNTRDLYGYYGRCHSQGLTLMACTALGDGDPSLENDRTFLLDPWHRQGLGWLRSPRQTALSCPVGQTCTTRLSLVSSPLAPPTGAAEVHRFDSGNNALMLEYRSKTLGYIYDDSVPQNGVVFWVAQFKADGEPEAIRTIPYPVPRPEDQNPPQPVATDGALFTVAPVACVGDPTQVASRGRGGSMQFGQSYRVRWVNGSDTGYLFTIGSPQADNTVVVSYQQTAQAPQCSQNSREYSVSSINEPSFPYLTHRGGVLNFTDTTINSGAMAATTASTTSYYLSTDRTFSANDVRIQSRTVPALAAGGSSTGTVTGTIPNTVPVGDNYVIACADSGNVVPETVETDNCVASVASWLVVF